MKTLYAKNKKGDADFGVFFTEQAFILESVSNTGGKTNLVLSDRTGQLKGVLSEESECDATSLVSEAVLINGTVWKDNGELLLKVKDLVKASEEDYKKTDLYPGISQDMEGMYLKEISQMISLVKHDGYKTLLMRAFNNNIISTFVLLPATLNSHGAYKGGLLAATATIARMAIDTGKAYVINTNGLYTSNVNWDRLITASLMHGFGNLRYFTSTYPYKKTSVGIMQGYACCLQLVISDIIKTYDIPLSDEDIAVLFNIMASAEQHRTPVKNATLEGLILGNVYDLYSECDHFDKVKSAYIKKEDEAFFYSPSLNSYVAL